MTDYGRQLSFGVSLDPCAGTWALTRRLARTAEDSGLDYLAVQDHPYQPGRLDAWTLITHLSAVTDRVSFLTDVADLQLRPPVMLAKAAASLSVLTDGRIQLGVGGGGIPNAIASMGGPARRGQDMVAFSRQRIIDEAAADAGRDPSTLRRVYNVIGVIGDHGDGPGLVGGVRRWVDTLAEWAVELGFDTFVFWPATDPERQLGLFTGEVVPAVRERVDAIRSGR
ncbi:LLM class flavin-dependent oxidoreductase [Nonomuraea africana]|uniref:LLM class flavin-dependent oxidoreductase n=1 Tax=Nonomuraea africana TaxID=46171 RepID=UPI0033FCC731